jgi:two-component system chemotaxis sensor kinase CheA
MSESTFNVESLLDSFFEEADEHLAAFEGGLLELEGNAGDSQVIATIFRAAHSIKGSSGMFGLTDVMTFTHALETVLDRLRNGELTYDAAVSKALLGSVDVLRALLLSARTNTPPPSEAGKVRASLEQFYAGAKRTVAESPVAKVAPAAAPKKPEGPATRSVSIAFEPKPSFMSRGSDPIAILRDIAAAGTVTARTIDASRIPPLDELDPEKCYLSFGVALETLEGDAALHDIFMFVDDLSTHTLTDATPPQPTEDAASAVEATSPAATDGHEHEGGPALHGPPAQAAGQAAGVAPATTIRVATEKIDRLLDLVGELVIAQAMIVEATRTPTPDAQTRLNDALGAMERHTRDLQERVMSIRMVPLSTVFRRLPRMVHDIAASVQKKVKLEIEGEGTEIDKSMVEQLVDPLTHLVRNAIDHAIETPEDRLAVGKDEEGEIRIRAFHQGGNVVIEVGDDGRGLNRDAILEKGIRVGLVAKDAELTDEEIHELIFQPGFSTAAKVSDLSGRGVGMDVVKRNVEALNGSLSLSTERGHGTRVRLRLPLTLAILEGLAVRVGHETFIVPLLSVVESFRPTRAQVRGVFGSPEVIDVRGTSLPIVRLHEVLGAPGAEEDPCRALICVVESNGGNLAVLVDEVLGQHQVVVKSLEVNFKKVDGLMGATILGDGRVAMIIDVQALSRSTAPLNGFDRGTRGFAPLSEAS